MAYLRSVPYGYTLRLLLFLLFLFAAEPAFSRADYFRAVQNGEEVTVICAGIPVYFEDNTPSTNSDYYVFYYLGPESYDPLDNDDGKILEKGDDGRYTYTFTQPGTYTITQIVNRGVPNTTVLEPRQFEVAATPEPRFAVQVCASGGVRVSIEDIGYDSYTLDYGDNTQEKTGLQPGEQPLYTYSGGGTYTITLRGSYTGGGCAIPVTEAVTVLPAPTIPVLTRLEVINQATAGELQLQLQNPTPGYRYIVERMQAGSYQAVYTTAPLTSDNPYTFGVPEINTSEASLYRLRPTDDCGTLLPTVSEPVSSIALQLQPGDERATISWLTAPGNLQNITLNRNGVPLASPTQNSFTDSGLSCGEEYCYQLAGIANGGQSVSLSGSLCLRAISTAIPPAGVLLSSYNTQNQVELELLLPAGQATAEVRYERRLDTSPFALLATESTTRYTDALQQARPVCYRAAHTNGCAQTAAFSDVSCPVYLTGQFQEPDGSMRLGWTGYVGFPDGVGSYTVEVLAENNQLLASYPVAGNTYQDRNLPADEQVLRYRIRVVSGSGAYTSYSNTLEIEQPLQVYIPTAFTPNGDGLNDVLEVKGRFIASFSLKVHNSMGQLVFSSDSRQNSWDGTYQGKPMPAGTYAYDLKATAPNGRTQRRTGTVTLLR